MRFYATPRKHWVLVVGIAAALVSMAAPADRFRPAQRRYWAFQPVVEPAVPQSVSRNPIDAFIEAKLTAKNLSLSPETDKITLLRRAHFDLTGLPPTAAEMEAFLSDRNSNAYESAIDRLLASPHYGERWARHWLDLARYAESDGFRADEVRPNAWRYRDYVIRSFNSGKPYDRFVQEQIAGDEMFPGDLDAKVATAFNRHYPDEYNAQNLRARRQEILNDITDTVGAVFLGLTFECARCHDHKFDPILQADYYKLQSFFSNISADDEFPMLPPAEYEEYKIKLAAWEEKTSSIRAQMAALVKTARDKQVKSRYTAYVDEVKTALDKPLEERTAMELWMADKAKYFMNPAEEALSGGLKGEAKAAYQRLKKQLDRYNDMHPGPLPKGTGLTELTSTVIPAHVLSVGVYNKPLEPVEPGFLTILHPEPAKIEAPAGGTSTGRRTALAKWLTDPKNPLTPRVMVNRIWHYHFGRGIVATTSDFGIMGERGTHPELLEWLAAEFVRSGWSMKHMHRLMMTSKVYRQSSAHRADAAAIDPANKLLWKFERRRLEAESIRDTALAVSGLLNPELFGPSVKPPLPAGVVGAWAPNDEIASHHRRSIYTFLRRNSLYPMLEVFDMPDTHSSCGRRSATTTAPQALTYLNSAQGMEWARGFATRVIEEAGSDRTRQVDLAYRLAYNRAPNGNEKDSALSFLAQHEPLVAERAAAGEKLASVEKPTDMSPAQTAAFVDFCHAIMNSAEFVYIN